MVQQISEDVSPLDVRDLRTRVQAVLDEVLDHQRAVLREVGPETGPLVDAIAELVSGGKRLRPAFCYWGWRGAGGADGALAVRVAASLELFQAAALLHDDVMDRSDTRRGRAAMHRQFAHLHVHSGWEGDADQFGTASAILAGDLCLSWNDELFSTALSEDGPAFGVDPERARAGTRLLDRMRSQLMAGQYLDVLAQASAARGVADHLSEGPVELARRVIRYKSAKYTVEHPLLIGGTLAGAPADVLAVYSRYGVALGEAFQLRDDVLGVFGDPAETGKPAGDDLREGKRTVLVALALERADERRRRMVEASLGDPGLDDDDVEALRSVLESTGAPRATEAMIDELVRTARAALEGAPLDAEAREVLLALTTTATARSA
ncbi:MAG: polyprenyl synthetase family protein [Actinomycetes bacterium]